MKTTKADTKQSEDRLQAECVKWFRYQYPHLVLYAIPNGGSRNAIEAAKLKRTGTLAGVADLFLMRNATIMSRTDKVWAVTSSHGLYIEMKIKGNKQTDKQKEFQEMAELYRYTYRVCYSFDEFQEIIKWYLNET